MTMRVAVVQTNPVFGKRQENIERTLDVWNPLRRTCIVLPELCTTGYSFTDKDEAESLAENAEGPDIRTVFSICA